MSQLTPHTTCSLIPAIDGDVQIVRSSRGPVVLDVQGCHRNASGDLTHDHGTVRLTYAAVCDLRDLLNEIAEPYDARQPSLPAIWSPATFMQPVRPPARSPRKRAVA